MKALAIPIICSGLLIAKMASAGILYPGPVDACTFYQNPWKGMFMQCAEPKIARSSCTKKKGVPPFVITYRGDRSSLYLPDFLIEVTQFWGKSVFSVTSALFRKHLKVARKYYRSQSLLPLASGFTDDGGSSGYTNSSFWQARILAVPGGAVTMSYPNVKAGGNGSVFPLCFMGVSELLYDQWQLGLADLPFAVGWAPVGIPACLSDAGAAANAALMSAAPAIQSGVKSVASEIMAGMGLPSAEVLEGISTPHCAYAVPGKTLMGLNLNPSADALNPLKVCMGSLGNLIPREGEILTEDVFRSAVAAAWKFASLVGTAYPQSGIGMEPGYKWQIVYPKSTRVGCFRPGSFSDFPPGPLEVRGPHEWIPKEDTYVFAIWRKRETHCQEPIGEADAWKAGVKAEHKIIEMGCGL